MIAGYLCRIWYASRRNQCDRCHKHHKTMDVDQCEAYRHNQPDVRVFAKGPFSNFSYCKMTMDNITFPTSEHAYQWHACMNHLCNDQAEKVMCAKTLREAKQITSQIKVNSVICDWENSRYGVMKKVILAKAEIYSFYNSLLHSDTGEECV